MEGLGVEQLFSNSKLGLSKLFQGLQEDLIVHALVVGEVAVCISVNNVK
jgi:hypothetical protein